MAYGHGIDFEVNGSTPGIPSAALHSYLLTRVEDTILFLNSVMIIIFQILFGGIAIVASNPTVYDQRQSGNTNVRVELKDAVIIAVGDGELGGDYDYNYDYSDLTVKPKPPTASTSTPSTTAIPPKSTTQKIATTVSTLTTNVNITQNAAVVLEAENNSIIFPATNTKPGIGSTEPVKIKPDSFKPDQIPVLILQDHHRPNKFLPVKTVEKAPTQAQIERAPGASIINPKELPMRHCSPGFFLDNHNRCKRIQKPTRERPQLPIGLRFDRRPLSRS